MAVYDSIIDEARHGKALKGLLDRWFKQEQQRKGEQAFARSKEEQAFARSSLVVMRVFYSSGGRVSLHWTTKA